MGAHTFEYFSRKTLIWVSPWTDEAGWKSQWVQHLARRLRRRPEPVVGWRRVPWRPTLAMYMFQRFCGEDVLMRSNATWARFQHDSNTIPGWFERGSSTIQIRFKQNSSMVRARRENDSSMDRAQCQHDSRAGWARFENASSTIPAHFENDSSTVLTQHEHDSNTIPAWF